MSEKTIIVGGVAGGASTAARLRRMDEEADIILIERGNYISFANCGLPYYVGGTIKERDNLLVQTPESLYARFRIDVRTKQEVEAIFPEKKKIQIRILETQEVYEESYDHLVLSPGSSPLRPRIEGIDLANIFTLWNIDDVDKIKDYVIENKDSLKKATVVGGGFIGLEMAENLYDLGLEVSIAEMADQVMMPIDRDMASLLHSHIKEKGVHLYLGNGVQSFKKNAADEKRTDVVLQKGDVLDSDIVLLAIGVRPNSELAMNASLSVNERKGIVVDEFLRTSDKEIYALGDAIEVTDYVNGHKTMVPLAGPANKQGRIVANNIAGMEDKYMGTQGSAVVKVFDKTVASTGNNEKTLNKLGKIYGEDYLVAIIIAGSHAGYYPDATSMILKLIFSKDGAVLGAQAVGQDGVDKRIDVIASAIHFGASIKDLKELELCYAPPYSSAKDPVNVLGLVAENILTKKMQALRPEEIKALDLDKVTLLDVRTKGENQAGAIEGSILIPVDELREHLEELDPSKEIAVYCAAGLRGYVASNILKAHGYKVSNLMGGYNFYSEVIKH